MHRRSGDNGSGAAFCAWGAFQFWGEQPSTLSRSAELTPKPVEGCDSREAASFDKLRMLAALEIETHPCACGALKKRRNTL